MLPAIYIKNNLHSQNILKSRGFIGSHQGSTALRSIFSLSAARRNKSDTFILVQFLPETNYIIIPESSAYVRWKSLIFLGDRCFLYCFISVGFFMQVKIKKCFQQDQHYQQRQGRVELQDEKSPGQDGNMHDHNSLVGFAHQFF